MKRKFLFRRGLNFALFIATLTIGGLSLIPAHLFPGASVVAIAFPLLVFPHLFGVIYWLVKRPVTAIYNVVSLALIAVPFLSQVPFAKGPDGQAPFTVATYNVRAFFQLPDAERRIAEWAETEKIDVLLMQEVRGEVLSALPNSYPHRVYAPKWEGFSVAIYSKYPILQHEALVFESVPGEGYSRRSALWADIVIEGDTLRVLNVHLGSTGVRDGDMSVDPEDELWDKGQNVARKIAASDRVRGLQGREIIRWVQESPYPVVLGGDFNSVTGGYLYARLMADLRDPYVFKGHGRMGSFEPLSRRYFPLRIDWTLCDPRLKVTGQFIDDVHLSDHRPLVTTFALPLDPMH